MGAGHSRNLCEAAASNEVDRARHFIKEDKDAVNKADKVCSCFRPRWFVDGHYPAVVANGVCFCCLNV